MIKRVINNAGDWLYLFLIDQLIELNKIKIIEKETSHFADMVDLA